EPLLDGEAARVHADQPRQLRDAEDLAPRNVGDVGDAVERQRVVLAEGEEADRPLDDLAVIAGDAERALRGERRAKLRVPVVAGGGVVERLQEAARRVARARRR